MKRKVNWTDVRAELVKAQADGRAAGLYISEPCCEVPRCLRCNNGWAQAWKPSTAVAFIRSCVN